MSIYVPRTAGPDGTIPDDGILLGVRIIAGSNAVDRMGTPEEYGTLSYSVLELGEPSAPDGIGEDWAGRGGRQSKESAARRSSFSVSKSRSESLVGK